LSITSSTALAYLLRNRTVLLGGNPDAVANKPHTAITTIAATSEFSAVVTRLVCLRGVSTLTGSR
jgi:hypothetical protein